MLGDNWAHMGPTYFAVWDRGPKKPVRAGSRNNSSRPVSNRLGSSRENTTSYYYANGTMLKVYTMNKP